MLTAMHTLIYSDEPEATRAFFRHVLGWPYVEHPESSPGWLIFRTGPSELGVHPTSDGSAGQGWIASRHHQVALMCDDLEATMADLSAKGAHFSGNVQDERFGRVAMVQVPGADDIMLYEPSHATAFDL